MHQCHHSRGLGARSRGKGDSIQAKTNDKGKSKVEKVDAMGVKKAKHDKSSQEKKGESNRQSTRPTGKKIGISKFAMGESSNPYDLLHDVCKKGIKINWPKLLHVAPKVRRQWERPRS